MKLRPVVLPVYGLMFGSLAVIPAHADTPVFQELGVLKIQFEPHGHKMVNLGDGYFYGAARWAESARGGVIYRVAPGQEAEVLYTFSPIENGGELNYGGANPSCSLIAGADGALYGATGDGGAFGRGTIFRISVDGIFSVIKDLELGASNIDNLIFTPQGDLFGSCNYGGSLRGGVLFRVDSNGIYQTVHEFNQSPSIPPATPVPPGSRNDFHSPTQLDLGADGNIYGYVSNGGLIYPSGNFRFTYGGMFRYNASGGVTMLSESTPDGDNAALGVKADDGFLLMSSNRKLIKTSFTGAVTTVANLESLGGSPTLCLKLPDGLYGTSHDGGDFDSGYIFRYVAGAGAEIIHHYGPEYRLRYTTLVAGNDGFVYGLAAFPEDYVPEEPVAASSISVASLDSRAKKKPKPPVIPRPRAFRFKAAAADANLVPSAKPDIVWLPAKAVNGKRVVSIDVLANDFDVDGDALSVTSLGELSGGGVASIISSTSGVRVQFETSDTDPASQVLTYRLSDGKGGEATGSVSIKSPLTGNFTGTATSEGEADAPLTLAIGKNNQVTATLVLNGRKYSGKATLDVDDTADISLKAKKQPTINLHLGLERGASREISATFSVGDSVYTATCIPKLGRK